MYIFYATQKADSRLETKWVYDDNEASAAWTTFNNAVRTPEYLRVELRYFRADTMIEPRLLGGAHDGVIFYDVRSGVGCTQNLKNL